MSAPTKSQVRASLARVLAALRWEATLQFRYGFYLVSAVVVAIWVALLRQLPAASAPFLVPALFVTGLFITTFYFTAALVLLEKAEGTLAALVVTPFRDVEYLGVKVASLAALALVENLLIALIGFGAGFAPLPLALGLIGLSALYALAGFVAVVRHDAINEFILPSLGYTMLLSLPLADHFGVLRSPLWLLHPTQPALVLMRAAFAPVPTGELAYGVVGSVVWIAVAVVLARRSFRRFAVRAAGG